MHGWHLGEIKEIVSEVLTLNHKFLWKNPFRLSEESLLRAFLKIPDLLKAMRKDAGKKLSHVQRQQGTH